MDWIGVLIGGMALVGATALALALAAFVAARRATVSVRLLRIELRAEVAQNRRGHRGPAKLHRVATHEDRHAARVARAKPQR